MKLRPSPEFSADQIVALAKAAKVHNEDWVQSFLRAAMLTNDTEIAGNLVEILKPRAIEELLKDVPLINPSLRELRRYLETNNPVLLGHLFESNQAFLQSIDYGAQHTLALGATGSGKTNFLYGQGLQARHHGVSCLFVDREKQDFRHLLRMWPDLVVLDLRDDFLFNPLQVPAGVDPAHWISSFVTVFVKTNNLLDGSEALLLRVVTHLYRALGVFERAGSYPTLYELRDALTKLRIARYSREAGFRDSLLNRLDAYLITNPNCYAAPRGIALEAIESTSIVLEARGLSERHVRCFISWLIQAIFARRIAANERGSGLSLQVYVDECKDIVPAGYNPLLGYSPLASLLAQCREIGLGFVFADQTAQLEEAVFVQARTKLCMRLGSGEDIEKVQRTFKLTDEQAAFIPRMEVGQAIVRVPGIAEPFLIQIPRTRLR